ncbi:MAG TPA: PAS domain-containing protein [Ktedonobacteraceae bacterium]|nr:PAS domain-containing protein [Ktedonobacteraceae bacterium]
MNQTPFIPQNTAPPLDMHTLQIRAEATPLNMWVNDAQGHVIYCNQNWCDYTGLSLEDVQDDRWFSVIHPDDLDTLLHARQRFLTTGEDIRVEVRLRRKDGVYRWHAHRGSAQRDSDGNILLLVGTSSDIDDRKRAEQEVRASEYQLRALINAIPQFVWVMRSDGSAEYSNQQWRDYTNMTHEQAQGDGWTQFLHPDDRQRVLEAWRTAVYTGRSYEIEQRIQNGRTGDYRWFLARSMPLRDSQGTILHWVGTCTDIDERKQAEERIKASENNWRMLAETVPQLVWTMQADGRVDYANQRYCEFVQTDFEQVRDRGCRLSVHPEDAERTLLLQRHSFATGEPYEIEYRLRDVQTGEYRWFLTRALAVRDEAGQITKWFATSTDIHDKKLAEEELRVLIDAIPHFVWTMRPDGSCEYCNRRWCDYTSMTTEQAQGDGWLQCVHPDDQQPIMAAWQRAFQTGMPFEGEERMRHGATGDYRWFLIRAIPHKDDQGMILKWFGTSTDIDERKRLEEDLRRSQEQTQILMNSNVIGIFIAEEEEIIEANETFLRMTGYSREDLREGKLNWARMTAPEYSAMTRQARQQLILHDYLPPYEKEYVGKDGSRLAVVVGGVKTQLAPFQTICFVLDNAARKELEQRKDDFISMASHELKTPLTSLKTLIQLQHRKLARRNVQDIATTLTKMGAQVDKQTRLIDELLDVSKINAGRMEYAREPIAIDALVGEIVETLQQTTETHRIVVHGAARKSLAGDADRLGQVFTNLLTNAIKYSPQADTVEVDITSPDDQTVTVSVRDFGIGIPSEHRDKIFERFYRVHDVHDTTFKGLGMGLYISSDIVRRHGGNIRVESALGNGSIFQVTLPLAAQAAR